MRLQNTSHGQGQSLARCIIGREQQLVECGIAVEVHWVLDHMGVKGNERADEAA